MTVRKMLSVALAAVGALVICAPSMAIAKPKIGILAPGKSSSGSSSWREGPFTAKDTRTLIYNVSRAGKKHQHMNLDKGIITRAGIMIKGHGCDRGDVWLSFWEQARITTVGGKRCAGEKTFQRRPGYTSKRYRTLMTYISDQLFAGAKIHGQDVGEPLLIRSNGHKALYLFDRNEGNDPAHSIRAVRLVDEKVSIER